MVLLVFIHPAKGQFNAAKYVENELIIWLKPGVNASEFAKNSEQDIKPKRLLSKRLNIWLFELPTGMIQRNAKVNNLRASNSVRFVQNNHTGINSRSVTPNDSLYSLQWAPAKIKLPEAWEYTTGGTSEDGDEIVIAVIDFGFFLPHEDMSFWKNPNETPNNGIDDDNNGYIDDYDGWNPHRDNDSIIYNDHGTHVAGIVGAIGDNSIGIVGVNWNVKILPIVIEPVNNETLEAETLEAFAYVLEMRALYNETNGQKGAFIVVANSSFGIDESGADPEDYPIWCAMYDELGAIGVLSCSAAPNADQNIDIVSDVPTSCSSNFLITVTNTDQNDDLSIALPPGYGATTVDVGAPGTAIWSTVIPSLGTKYADNIGTSMATPQVAGVVALMYSAMPQCMIQAYKANPASFALAVRQQLLEGADAVASLNGLVAHGRLNALKAIENTLGISSTPPSVSGPSIICTNETFTLQNQPVGFSITWSSSNPTNLSINATTGVATRQNNFNGQVTITASVAAGCVNFTKNIWVGHALIEDILYPTSTVAPYQLIPLSIETAPNSSNGYFKAEINRMGGGYSHTTYGNVMEFSLPMTGTFNVKVYADNTCGWPQSFYPLVFFCTEGGGMFAVYPNPASETLTIESKDQYSIDKGHTDNKQASIIFYRLYDPNSGNILAEGNLSTKRTEIDVSKLSKGKYLLTFQVDNQKEEMHHVIIE